jgi:DNA polymerase
MESVDNMDIGKLGLLFEYYRALGYDRLPLDIPETACKDRECLLKEEALKGLKDEIGDCKRCSLSEKRTKLVFGDGNPDAELMFIGEAPGLDEDIQGIPFVGKAGTLLTRLIERMGFSRDKNDQNVVYIANVVKCRPPDNRDPLEDEIDACLPFLISQIEIVRPKVIMTLGAVATRALLGPVGSISRVRGRVFRYKGIPLVPTFHPSYLLRNPKDKWLTWSDAQVVLRLLNL